MARLGLGPDWTCQFANDRDAAKAQAYIANFSADHFNGADVASLTLADLPPGRPDLVWASPPCKDVSAAGPRIGLNGKRSAAFWPWWSLMRQLIDAGRGPRVIVIENVDTLLTSNNGGDIASIRKAIDDVGYDHKTFLIDARHFVPQSRKRVFIVVAPKGQTIPDLPPMPRRNTTLAGLIDFEASCDPAPKTERLVKLMAPLHKARLETAKVSGRRTVLMGCRRTRRPQRFEVRDDGLAGALRTAGGGSSTQSVILVDGASVRSRKLLKREAARLMGLPETYRLPESATHANNLTGDGVVVPVVTFLAAHLIEPLMAYAKAAMASKPRGASEDRSRRPPCPDHRKRRATRRAFCPPQTVKSAGMGMTHRQVKKAAPECW
jgi:DNA (cytosine-5)-methyltransferase 1